MLFGHCSVLKRKKSFHTMTSNTSTQTTSSDSFFQKIPKADQITLVTQFLEDEHDSERGKDIMGILAEIQHARLTTISKMPVVQLGAMVAEHSNQASIKGYLQAMMGHVFTRRHGKISALIQQLGKDRLSEKWDEVATAFKAAEIKPFQQAAMIWGYSSWQRDENLQEILQEKAIEVLGQARGEKPVSNPTSQLPMLVQSGNSQKEAPTPLDAHFFDLLLEKGNPVKPLVQQFIEVTPNRLVSATLAGVLDAWSHKPPAANAGSWYWYGRYLVLMRQGIATACEDVITNGKKPAVISLFTAEPFLRYGQQLAAILTDELAKRKPIMLPQLFPKSLWSRHEDSIQRDLLQQFECTRWREPAKALEAANQLSAWPSMQKLAEARALRANGKFTEAEKVLESVEASELVGEDLIALELDLCAANVAHGYNFQVASKSQVVDTLVCVDDAITDIEEDEGFKGVVKKYGFEVLFLSGIFSLCNDDLFNAADVFGYIGASDPVFGKSARLQNCLWMALLLGKDKSDIEEAVQIAEALDKEPTELAFFPEDILNEALAVLLLFPKETAPIGTLLLKHLPASLDNFLTDPLLAQQKALRQRLLAIGADESDEISQWAHLQRLVRACQKAGDKETIIDALELCESASQDEKLINAYCKLLEGLTEELPAPWDLAKRQRKLALLYVQAGHLVEAHNILLPLLQRALGTNRRSEAMELLAEVEEIEEGQLDEVLQGFKTTLTASTHSDVNKESSDKITFKKPVSVLYVGIEWESRPHAAIADAIQSDYPGVRMDMAFDRWETTGLNALITRAIGYDIIVIGKTVCNDTCRRIKNGSRAHNRTVAQCDGKGRVGIRRFIVETLRDFAAKSA